MKHPLETYITLYKSKGILVDWWEEGEDKICFELNTHSLANETFINRQWYALPLRGDYGFKPSKTGRPL